ncbi:MAG TPA: hypothetical protein VFX47_07595 [Gammaproteobacteria bacterium]|nr:hypothetical protein [Gammaproteobacteria bacterium]
MTLISGLLTVTGILAMLYGISILWVVAASHKDLKQDAWLESDEVRDSKFNNLHHLRYLINGKRSSISSSRSKGRGYAMLAVGIVLLAFAFT